MSDSYETSQFIYLSSYILIGTISNHAGFYYYLITAGVLCSDCEELNLSIRIGSRSLLKDTSLYFNASFKKNIQ